MSIFLAFLTLLFAFAVLAKSADWFVEGAVAFSEKLHLPRLLVGMVVVGLATSAPELTVSVLSSLKGNPEMALGNAVGSVICDDGLALPAVAVFSAAVVSIHKGLLVSSGFFLVFIDVLAFVFVLDSTLSPWEGTVLVGTFVVYTVIVYMYYRKKKDFGPAKQVAEIEDSELLEKPLTYHIFLLVLGLSGVLFASESVIEASIYIAEYFNVPEAVIALTMVALGTSIPEVATCITAALKNEGEIAVGNIFGSDILNICWVAGASSMLNPLTVEPRMIFFMFPAMLVIVITMLLLLRHRYCLTKSNGIFLLVLYLGYIVSLIYFFPPHV